MEKKSFKLGMFGGGGVGKTSITLQFVKKEFTEGYIPTIEDEFSKSIDIDGQKVDLEIIDTAGQDDFAEMRHRYFQSVKGFVFVFSIIEPNSVLELKKLYNEAKEANQAASLKCVVAANKEDLRESNSNPVNESEHQKIEAELNTKVFKTSAKNGMNIEEVYTYIVKSLLNNKPASSAKSGTNKGNSGSDGGCCEIQ